MKVFVKVKTRAKQAKVEKTGDGSFEISVKESDEKGLANQAIVKALAKHLEITQNEVRVLSGHASSRKIVALDIKN